MQSSIKMWESFLDSHKEQKLKNNSSFQFPCSYNGSDGNCGPDRRNYRIQYLSNTNDEKFASVKSSENICSVFTMMEKVNIQHLMEIQEI